MANHSKAEEQAREAAKRIEDARALGQQLTFLPDADGQGGQLVAESPRAPGRPKGSKNKVDNQLRKMLAAKGMRMPEEQLAEIAGLSSRDDVFVAAMARTEQVLAWAGGQKVGGFEASPAMRLGTFIDIFKAMIRAAEAMLPYGLAKVTPDEHTNINAVQIVMPATGAPGDDARVIEGRKLAKHAPPPLPKKSQQKQGLANPEDAQSDNGSRTE